MPGSTMPRLTMIDVKYNVDTEPNAQYPRAKTFLQCQVSSQG